MCEENLTLDRFETWTLCGSERVCEETWIAVCVHVAYGRPM